MSRAPILLAAFGLTVLFSAPVGQRPANAAGLVGTWRLMSYEDRPDQGPTQFPYGSSPTGLLIYDATGHMAVQVMKVPHPKVASGDEERVTDGEKMALFDAYIAYFGTYRVEASRGVVIHHAEGDLSDTYIGRDEERHFDLSGDRLVLSDPWVKDGKGWRGTRVFERVK